MFNRSAQTPSALLNGILPPIFSQFVPPPALLPTLPPLECRSLHFAFAALNFSSALSWQLLYFSKQLTSLGLDALLELELDELLSLELDELL